MLRPGALTVAKLKLQAVECSALPMFNKIIICSLSAYAILVNEIHVRQVAVMEVTRSLSHLSSSPVMGLD